MSKILKGILFFTYNCTIIWASYWEGPVYKCLLNFLEESGRNDDEEIKVKALRSHMFHSAWTESEIPFTTKREV